jgi:hypothetical protein
MENVSDILEAIRQTEFSRVSDLKGPAGPAVLNLIREVDLVYLYLRGSQQFTPDYTNFFETIHQYGWPTLLQKWYPEIKAAEFQHPAPVSSSTTAWVDTVIHTAGKLARCSQLVAFCRAGLGELTRPDEKQFVFTPVSYANSEAYDILDFRLVQKEIVEKAISRLAGRDGFNSAQVAKRITLSVQRPDSTVLSYHATGYVKDYYIRQGHYRIQRQQFTDDFGPDDLFDGIPYRDYVTMTEYLAGMALMHKAYCDEAFRKYGPFEIRNVLTPVRSEESMVAGLARHLRRPEEEAARMLSRVTLTRDNQHDYLSIASAAPPPLIRVSGSQLIHSAAGSINNPFQFLNHELKRTCYPDYSRVVNNREDRFREMIFRFFQGERFIRVPISIRMSVDGRRTDIDAVVFDKETKTLGLFQLKWQNPFAHSMQKRYSVLTNLGKNAQDWLEKVITWVGRQNTKTLLNALQITKHTREEKTISSICYFVIGRHGMHFTGIGRDDRAAWGSWPQLMAGTLRTAPYKGPSDPIRQMHEQLRYEEPRLRMERDGQLLPKSVDLLFSGYEVRITGKD